MHTSLAKIFLLVLALTLAVPESIAKRTGGGRSVGRQSSTAVRPRPAPPPTASRAQPAPPPQPAQAQRPQPAPPPPAARQEPPPNSPERAIPRHASSPWGGFLGGALLGLGLGSLLGDRDNDTVNRSEGGSDTGTAASGAGGNEEVQATGQGEQRGFGSAWWLGILALVVFFLVRRARRRTRRH